MEVKVNPLVVIMVLAVLTNCLRTNHERIMSFKCSDKYPGAITIKSFNQYLEAEVPTAGFEWNHLQVHSGPNEISSRYGFSPCFLFENGKLYLIGDNGSKAYVLPTRLVPYTTWEFAYVAKKKFIDDSPQRQIGNYSIVNCTIQGLVKIKYTQSSSGKDIVSYLVNAADVHGGFSSYRREMKFLGAGYKSPREFFVEQNYCFKLE